MALLPAHRPRRCGGQRSFRLDALDDLHLVDLVHLDGGTIGGDGQLALVNVRRDVAAGRLELRNVPALTDIDTMLSVMAEFGVVATLRPGRTVVLDASGARNTEAESESERKCDCKDATRNFSGLRLTVNACFHIDGFCWLGSGQLSCPRGQPKPPRPYVASRYWCDCVKKTGQAPV